MQLEMISTGEEVLSGQITDTNAAWFADTMMSLGIELQQRTTVGDRMADLVRIFTERSHTADAILVNGGLGPTSDDLSAEAMAKAAGVPLVENQHWRLHLQDWFARRGRTMSQSNLKQCLVPEGAILVDNPAGSAPGFRIKLNRAWLFFTPGVPFEFKQMVTEQFVPFIRQNFAPDLKTRLHKFLTIGHGESTLADRVSKLPVPAGITLGYRPSAPHVEIKVFARGAAALSEMDAYLSALRSLLDDAVVTERFPSIPEELHNMLRDSGYTLALAESCTGGMLSSLLVEHAGSSNYLMQGLVTYSNEAKHRLLGVPMQVLETHGAVSTECALAMARGAQSTGDTDFALAITGIAGPDGGSAEKPVGTVVIALADRESCWVQTVALGQRSRTLVRTMSCAVALDMLRRRLLDRNPLAAYSFISAKDARVEKYH
ncbi:MAG: hypothetical protein RLZZ227_2577 [Pseudomonadota bacterium]|jgi:nicotinamide-nucleotide amidase